VTAATDEVRRRIDVPADFVSDAQLDAILLVAGNAILPWLGSPVINPHPYQANIDEATIQLAVKLWDVSAKGVAGVDAVGDFTMPAPSATPGLIRSVFGVLGPALGTAGVSV
jgi:hypothetical protein